MQAWIALALAIFATGLAWRYKKKLNFGSLPRPLQLVLAVSSAIVVVGVADYVATGDQLARQFFWPQKAGIKAPEWKDLFQALLLFMGLPVALLVWHWRDRNAHHQIENARADLSLRESQELQIRAAGGFDQEIPVGARVALQVAALHQLRPYLSGGYGKSFQLAAFELFCSMLEAEIEQPVVLPAGDSEVGPGWLARSAARLPGIARYRFRGLANLPLERVPARAAIVKRPKASQGSRATGCDLSVRRFERCILREFDLQWL